MRMIRFVAVALLAGGMIAGTSSIAQSAQTDAQTTAQVQGAQSNWTMEQLITSSVHDAWVMSGRNEAKFFDMVAQLAQISAQKRGLTLPDSEASGKHFGELVKTMAKTDHDQLLYVVVDKAVQQIATKS